MFLECKECSQNVYGMQGMSSECLWNSRNVCKMFIECKEGRHNAYGMEGMSRECQECKNKCIHPF